MKIKLNKGNEVLDLDVPDDRVLDILIGRDVPGLGHEAVSRIICEGIRDHMPEDISSKKIALIIPDDTRLWARGDLYVPQIVNTLFACGVDNDRITIVIAVGTHRAMPEDLFSDLAGTFCARQMTIVNSANQDRDRLVFIDNTHKGTALFITKEAAEADHLIIFGGVLHHMLAGFGGGRKYILPGIAGYDSIQQNHSLAFRKDGTPHPLVRQGQLWGNPVNEDLVDAARLVLRDRTCTCVTLAVNGTGQIFHAAVGDLESTFMAACRRLDNACRIPVAGRADFAVISTGGHRTDTQLYQSTKALFNAVNIVKPGGEILFIAGCAGGTGNAAFEEALTRFRDNPEQIGKKLSETFSMPEYVAFRVIDILNRFRVTLLSDLDEQTTTRLGFRYADDASRFVSGMTGKGFIIPFAENVLPVAAERPGQGK